MKKIFLIFFASAAILFSGCNKYLDVKPKGYTIPEFFDDYQRLLNNSSLYATPTSYPSFLTDDVQSGVTRDPNLNSEFEGYDLSKRNLYTFASGAVLEDGQSDGFYEPAYARIFVYNTVINNVGNVPDGTEAAKKKLKAEAQIGRAFEYLTLVNGYGVHYDPATAATDLGVPMVLSEDINKSYERVTVAAVYSQVKTDIDEALPSLSLTASHPFLPTKAAAYALLSRMYLYMGNYEKALENANAALTFSSALIDYSQYTTQKSTWGRVHLTGDVNVSFPDYEHSMENVWSKGSASSDGNLFTQVYASEDLLNVYKSNLAGGAIDKRFALFFVTD